MIYLRSGFVFYDLIFKMKVLKKKVKMSYLYLFRSSFSS